MKLAVVVSYRDRYAHLRDWLPDLRAHLLSQQLEADVYVVEQCDERPFNRGALLNTGVALLAPDYTHVVLHDVDLIPLRDVDYSPCDMPTQLCGHATQFGTQGPPAGYFGGATMFPREQFLAIDGYNNNYWGWGCEDDDLLDRVKRAGLKPQWRTGSFRSLPHAAAHTLPEHSHHYSANFQRLVTNRAGKLEDSGISTLNTSTVRLSMWMGAVMIHTQL